MMMQEVPLANVRYNIYTAFIAHTIHIWPVDSGVPIIREVLKDIGSNSTGRFAYYWKRRLLATIFIGKNNVM